MNEEVLRKERLIKKFQIWLSKQNINYLGMKSFDCEFHVYQTIDKNESFMTE